MKEITSAAFVAATPIEIKKGKIIIGESTIVPSEKNIIVLKKNKRSKQ